MAACLAARDVNICLVPEFQYDMHGDKGLLEYVYQRIKVKGRCVIVVTEGVVNSFRDFEMPKVKDSLENTRLNDIGQGISENIVSYCRERDISVSLKYLNALYLVRSCAANSLDTKLCSQLAQNAVHGAMAGFTNFVVGHVANKTCLIPTYEMISGDYCNKITSQNNDW